MIRHAATRLLNRSASAAVAGGSRRFSTDLASAPSADEAFVSAWTRTVPNIDPPKTPLSFMQPRPPTPSSIPSKLKINFVLPYASEFSNKEIIDPAGWTPWNSSNLGLDTIYYGEYQNTGPGANTANRVKWPGYHVITRPEETGQQDLPSIISSMEMDPAIECTVCSGSLTQGIDGTKGPVTMVRGEFHQSLGSETGANGTFNWGSIRFHGSTLNLAASSGVMA